MFIQMYGTHLVIKSQKTCAPRSDALTFFVIELHFSHHIYIEKT